MTDARLKKRGAIISELLAEKFQSLARWFADNMWLFVPIAQKTKEFLVTIPQYPFQAGEVLQPSDINYKTLTVAGALKKMQEVQLQIANPQN
jgi:arylsulfatase